MSDQLTKALINLENAAICLHTVHADGTDAAYAELLSARLEVYAAVGALATGPSAPNTDFGIATYMGPEQGHWSTQSPKGVRVTHKSGAFEECHSSRSQHTNKQTAMQRLQNRLAITATQHLLCVKP